MIISVYIHVCMCIYVCMWSCTYIYAEATGQHHRSSLITALPSFLEQCLPLNSEFMDWVDLFARASWGILLSTAPYFSTLPFPRSPTLGLQSHVRSLAFYVGEKRGSEQRYLGEPRVTMTRSQAMWGGRGGGRKRREELLTKRGSLGHEIGQESKV